jgi:uncharacterized membrane protein
MRTAPFSTEPGSGEEVNGVRRSLIAGILMGIGVAGFVDETVFHQILHWHHFYDLSTPSWGLISDGLFHAFSWFCIIGGFFIFADLRRRTAWRPTWHVSGFLFGLGGFQLWDGTIQHKWWHLHEIRYHRQHRLLRPCLEGDRCHRPDCGGRVSDARSLRTRSRRSRSRYGIRRSAACPPALTCCSPAGRWPRCCG